VQLHTQPRGKPRLRALKKPQAPPPEQEDGQSSAGESDEPTPEEHDHSEQGEPAPEETDPAKVNGPVSTAVHQALRNAWVINKAHPMCFIFDSVSPARRFKWGFRWDEEREFPEEDPQHPSDATESDSGKPFELMPFMPGDY
jgi:hypothetical protein